MNILFSLLAALIWVSGSQYLLAQADTVALKIGDTVSDSLPTENAKVVYTLDVPANEFFTVNFVSEAEEGTMFGSAAFVVRDASGADVLPVSPSQNVYWAGEALPYTLIISGFNFAYTIELQAGETPRTDRGALTLGETISGELEPGNYDVYTLEAAANDRVTLRYTVENFVTGVYPQQAAESEGFVGRESMPPNISLSVQEKIDPFGVTSTDVYRFPEDGSYDLIVDSPTGGSYEILVEAGDTVERQEMGTLAPGHLIEATMPAQDGNQYTIRLDVEAGETYTVEQWSDTLSAFSIVDADLVSLVATDRYVSRNDALQFTVDENTVLPIDLMIYALDYDAGKPLLFTLMWGDVAISPEEVAAETSGETQEPSDSGDCTVSNTENVNQRKGPGTTFAVMGNLAAGMSAAVDGQATDADGFVWWRLGEGIWVRADVVVENGDCAGVPAVP